MAKAAIMGCVFVLVLIPRMVARADSFNEDLESALSRAPDVCKEKFLAYDKKQEAYGLKLKYDADDVSKDKCNPDTLMVTGGSEAGRIMRLPNGKAEGLQHHHLSGMKSEDLEEGESLAFLILAHGGQSHDFLQRLVGNLARPEHFVMIHVDAKAPKELHEFVAKLGKTVSGNVKAQAPAREVAWGGSSMLQVMIEGTKLMLEWSEDWKHLFFISGSDFPVKTVEHMSKVMHTFGATSHFEIFHQLPQYVHNRGADQAWVECENFVYKVGTNRPQPRGMDLWGGSSWVTLSREFSQWLTHCLYKWSERDPNNFFKTKEGTEVLPMCRTAVDFLDYCENMLSAEELYFQTVFMNSMHCVNLDTRYLRWVHWLEGKNGEHCGETADWCGKSPGLVELQQVRTALQLPAFFIRKVGQNQGMDLVNYIEKRLQNGTSAPALLPLEKRGTKASSYERGETYSNVPSMATDGNDYTRWSSVHGSDKEWIQVELIHNADVCGVTIAWEHARALEFQIKTKPAKEGSDKWKVAYKYTIGDPKNKHAERDRRLHGNKLENAPHYDLERYSFPRVNAKMVRISLLQRSSIWGFSVFEIEVHGCPSQDVKGQGKNNGHEEL
eukprot:CAMPEP_0173430894 /NCGR_PEP_ID=MMETSP1357-20121228/9195_1 /TAXON_ID=77926 /ORGANISM="Hemiselmis rufescens, Strain PCC563" /LENGTH=609 /DNA_ID=CAMNT_0014395305 /DNA_START=135 /DNA_END=1964 /DNA_ORIENTATION=-